MATVSVICGMHLLTLPNFVHVHTPGVNPDDADYLCAPQMLREVRIRWKLMAIGVTRRNACSYVHLPVVKLERKFARFSSCAGSPSSLSTTFGNLT